MNGHSVPALLAKGDRVKVQLLSEGEQSCGIFLRYFVPENCQILKAELLLESGHYAIVDLVNIIPEPMTRDAVILAFRYHLSHLPQNPRLYWCQPGDKQTWDQGLQILCSPLSEGGEGMDYLNGGDRLFDELEHCVVNAGNDPMKWR
jgi:hypothetical protein